MQFKYGKNIPSDTHMISDGRVWKTQWMFGVMYGGLFIGVEWALEEKTNPKV